MSLPQLQWGTVFPIYTTLACTGKSYAHVLIDLLFLRWVGNYVFGDSSIDSSLQLYDIGLFWIVVRYNILYVTGSGHDSGGTLYPILIRCYRCSIAFGCSTT